VDVIRLAALGRAPASALELSARAERIELCAPDVPADVLLIDDALALDSLPSHLASLPRVELTEGPSSIPWERAGEQPRADAYVSNLEQLALAVQRVGSVVAELHRGPPRLVFIGHRWSDAPQMRPLFDEAVLTGQIDAGRAGDFVLYSPAIVRRHTRFHWDPAAAAVRVTDLLTTNGTAVNGEHLGTGAAARRLVYPGDEIAIGIHTRLRIAFGPR
jgi:hypothetical protein